MQLGIPPDPVGRLMTGVRVWRAGPPHLDGLVPLFDGYRQFYRRPSNPGAVRAFLTERLARGDSVVFLAALEPAEAPVGFTQLYPTFSSVSLGRAWILNDLYVAPPARGRGVGEALLLRAREHAEATGALYLELMTERSNRTAKALYHRLGWIRDEQFDHYELDLRRG